MFVFRLEAFIKPHLFVRPSVRPPAGEEQNEPKTHLELMAEMRDYKRRRQSYRAKNVHITKKSYTEVPLSRSPRTAPAPAPSA